MRNEKSFSLKKFILSWDAKFPIDRWWRQKYNVSFNSPTHREFNFIDMYIEFTEDRIFDDMLKDEKDIYIAGEGNFLKKKEVTQEEYLSNISKIDLTQFDDKP